MNERTNGGRGPAGHITPLLGAAPLPAGLRGARLPAQPALAACPSSAVSRQVLPGDPATVSESPTASCLLPACLCPAAHPELGAALRLGPCYDGRGFCREFLGTSSTLPESQSPSLQNGIHHNHPRPWLTLRHCSSSWGHGSGQTGGGEADTDPHGETRQRRSGGRQGGLLGAAATGGPSGEGAVEGANDAGLRSRQRPRQARGPEPGPRCCDRSAGSSVRLGVRRRGRGGARAGENGRAGPVRMVPAAGPGEPRAVLAAGAP